MSTFISGGASSGKSMWAQRVAVKYGSPRYYIATMIPRDDEDRARVRRHREARAGWGFQTIECGGDILRCLDAADPGGAFLLDSVTALLANAMFAPDGMCPDAPRRIADELAEFVRRAPKTVLVSDFIYADALRYDPMTEAFRAGLADVDRRLAQCCDDVLEAVCGQIVVHKGSSKTIALADEMNSSQVALAKDAGCLAGSQGFCKRQMTDIQPSASDESF